MVGVAGKRSVMKWPSTVSIKTREASWLLPRVPGGFNVRKPCDPSSHLLTTVWDKKRGREEGRATATCPNMGTGFNTPTEQIVGMLFLCATLSIIRYGLWTQQTVYTTCCMMIATTNKKKNDLQLHKKPLYFVINIYISLWQRYQITQ